MNVDLLSLSPIVIVAKLGTNFYRFVWIIEWLLLEKAGKHVIARGYKYIQLLASALYVGINN